MSKEEIDHLGHDIEDVGWSRMQVLLDREMPTKRRPFFWWILSGAALVVLAASVIFSQGMMDRNDLDQVTTTNAPKSVEVDPSAPPEHDTAPLDGKRDEGLPVEKEAPSDSEDAATAKPQTPLKDRAILPEDLAAKVPRPEKQIPAVDDQMVDIDRNKAIPESPVGGGQDQVGTVEPEGTTSGVDQSAAMLRQNKGIVDPAASITEYHPFIRTKDLSLARHPVAIRTVTYEPTMAPVEAESTGQWHFGLQAAGLMDNGATKFSWDAGAGLQFHMSNKVAISTGAYFWQVVDNEDFSWVENSGTLDDQSLRVNTLEPEMPALDSFGVSVGVSQVRWARTRILSYLRVPLHVMIFPQSRWSPHLGLSMVQLISNKSGLRQAEFSALDAQGAVNYSEISDLLRRFNMTLDIGIRYQVSPHLVLDLSHIRAFKSYLNYEVGGSGVPEIHRTWRLSLGYQF